MDIERELYNKPKFWNDFDLDLKTAQVIDVLSPIVQRTVGGKEVSVKRMPGFEELRTAMEGETRLQITAIDEAIGRVATVRDGRVALRDGILEKLEKEYLERKLREEKKLRKIAS